MKSKRKSFVEKATNSLLNVLLCVFGVILLVSIYTGIQTKVLKNDYTDFFGYSIFEVQTGSMSDTINAGDWIVVKLTNKAKLNDIITYKQEKEYITHRVIEVYNGTYVTKGDANSAKDDPIDQNKMVGKVVKTLAGFGILRKTLFNPTVLIALIVTLFLFNLAFKKSKKLDDKIKKIAPLKEEQKYSFINNIISPIKALIKKLKSRKKTISFALKIKKMEKKNKKKPVKKEENITINKNKEVEVEYLDFDDEIQAKEEELDKTSLYRVIPVNEIEVDEKYKGVPTKEEIKEVEEEIEEDLSKEEDLEKTSLYRVIPVDMSEINDTFLEIAKNEIKENKDNDKNKDALKKESVKEEILEEDQGLTNINLDLLKSKKNIKKSKNIVDKVILIKKEEIEELIYLLIEDYKNNHNVEDIKDVLINTYVDAKYYNSFGYKDSLYNGKNIIAKIEKIINAVSRELKKDYHGNDKQYKDIVEMYAKTLILIANLELGRDSINDNKAKMEFYKKEILKCYDNWDVEKAEYTIYEIIKVQKNYVGILEYFLKKIETNMFGLTLNKLGKKEIYGIELKHNISFSRVYSDYIIDKTYSEGMIAEDKMPVLLTLLLVQLVKDMTTTNFNRKYVIYVPDTLYSKEKKFESLLKMIDDQYARDNVLILITFKDLLDNIEFVKKVRKMGYKFALVFDRETTIKEKDCASMNIADYIFINKKYVDVDKMIDIIPDELSNKVVYEELVGKVGDFGGE